MSLPNFQEMMLPALQAFNRVPCAKIPEIEKNVAKALNLSREQNQNCFLAAEKQHCTTERHGLFLIYSKQDCCKESNGELMPYLIPAKHC